MKKNMIPNGKPKIKPIVKSYKFIQILTSHDFVEFLYFDSPKINLSTVTTLYIPTTLHYLVSTTLTCHH